MRVFKLLPLVGLVISAGCAQKSDKISAAYVSPVAYQTYSCRQLAEEAQRVSSRGAQIMGVQNKQAESDAVATGVALVLFWPAAFFIKGNKTNAAEVARLKGEMEAIEQASIKKNCKIKFEQMTPKEAETKAAAKAKKPE